MPYKDPIKARLCSRKSSQKYWNKQREVINALYYFRNRRQRRDTEREETEKFIERFEKHEERSLQMPRMLRMFSTTPLAEILGEIERSNKSNSKVKIRER